MLDSSVHVESWQKHKRFLRAKINQKNFAAFVAETNHELVGFIHGEILFSEGARIGIIQNVYVKEPYRSRKVGKALVRALLSWFKQKRVERIQSFVRARNKKAFAFWKKLGFQVRGYQIESSWKTLIK